jgi:hypothetical protein
VRAGPDHGTTLARCPARPSCACGRRRPLGCEPCRVVRPHPRPGQPGTEPHPPARHARRLALRPCARARTACQSNRAGAGGGWSTDSARLGRAWSRSCDVVTDQTAHPPQVAEEGPTLLPAGRPARPAPHPAPAGDRVSRCRHCRVWATVGRLTVIVCAHCDETFADWISEAGDDERVAQSQWAHVNVPPNERAQMPCQRPSAWLSALTVPAQRAGQSPMDTRLPA